jgi:hypothetical protein
MDDETVERRTFIAFVVAAAGGVVALVYGLLDQASSNGGVSPQTTPESGTETTATQTPSSAVDVERFGLEADGETDDTQAIVRALRKVPVGGTLRLPPGDIVIAAKGDSDAAITLPPKYGVTIEGAGTGSSGTRLLMASNHANNHTGLAIKSSDGDSSSSQIIQASGDREQGEVVIRDLVLDGNWSEQKPDDGDWMNGFGIDIRGGEQPVTIENCVVQNWVTNGGLMGASGIRVRNCTFRNNGWGVHEEGRRGHGFNVNTSDSSGRVVAENCYFKDNVGQAVDNNGGKVTVRNCIFDGHEFGIKMDADTEDVLLENVHIIGNERTEIPIKCIPTGNESTGSLRLRSVIIENARWPAIDLPQRPGPVSGDNILIRNVDQDNHRGAGFYIRSGRNVDIGTLSVHDISGSALNFEGARGNIKELVYSGVSGVGETADVSIGAAREGDPISVSVPSKSEVGAGRSSSSRSGGSSGSSGGNG